MKNPNTIFFIFIFILLTFQFSVLVFSQDSCNSKLNLKSRLPFDATSLNCLPIWSNEDFVLRYGQSEASGNIWSFVLSTPNPKSFVAMGFSTTGRMVGSSAIVGWVESDGTAMMKRYYLGGTSPALVVKDQGNVSLVEGSSSVVVESSRFYMSFQLDMDQPSSRLVFSVGPNGFSPIGPDYRLMEHRNKIATSINYSTGESATEKAPHLKLRRSHGILNMIGWGILMMIGSMIARYGRKWDPAWFYAHATCQVLAFTLGLIGVICGFLLDSRLDVNVSTHKGLGIFILVLGCLQVVAILARPDKASKVRKYWNWYHYIVGRILIIFAISNVFYGIHLGGEGKGWTAAYAVVLSVLFLSSAVFEYKLLTTKN
ncbi:cytochrome b561 and DOMON domain-containing protein At3g07570 [Cannabis sativa]|uniref:cytochrome b561 and DOMON domain-containing protein At3g07570 n=1 Tax=Cannabis sativa TaxID=3483 RepID=UPI0029CA7605|nr:cytochrome b561 and DOMON domain-containing protein At3g07570 [Cannabis sativa]